MYNCGFLDYRCRNRSLKKEEKGVGVYTKNDTIVDLKEAHQT